MEEVYGARGVNRGGAVGISALTMPPKKPGRQELEVVGGFIFKK